MCGALPGGGQGPHLLESAGLIMGNIIRSNAFVNTKESFVEMRRPLGL